MVICFSGTGNSRAVATDIARRLDTTCVELTGSLLTNPSAHQISAEVDNTIVWVFPVYSWGVPPVVVRFIRECRIENAERCLHHLVVTCGDDAGLTASQWRRLIGKRGWTSGSATSVIMPNTYVLMKGFDTDPTEVAEKKLKTMPAMVEKAVSRIAGGAAGDLIVKGRFPCFKSRVIYPWFKRYAMSPRPFHSLDNCISCGVCARSCPMDNIIMTAGRPAWNDRCALCLRCYHGCPVHAVAYGKATLKKGQYLYPGK